MNFEIIKIYNSFYEILKNIFSSEFEILDNFFLLRGEGGAFWQTLPLPP